MSADRCSAPGNDTTANSFENVSVLAEDRGRFYESRFDIRLFGGAGSGGISSGGFSSAWRSSDCSGDCMALKYVRLAMNRRDFLAPRIISLPGISSVFSLSSFARLDRWPLDIQFVRYPQMRRPASSCAAICWTVIAFNPPHFWALFASMQSWRISSGALRTGLNTVLSGMRFDPPNENRRFPAKKR
jgi:hypothetical protein